MCQSNQGDDNDTDRARGIEDYAWGYDEKFGDEEDDSQSDTDEESSNSDDTEEESGFGESSHRDNSDETDEESGSGESSKSDDDSEDSEEDFDDDSTIGTGRTHGKQKESGVSVLLKVDANRQKQKNT